MMLFATGIAGVSAQEEADDEAEEATQEEEDDDDGALDDFKFYLGANFDFGEKIIPNSFYAEFNATLLNLVEFKDTDSFASGIGLMAGLYKNRLMNIDSSVSLSFNYQSLLGDLTVSNDSQTTFFIQTENAKYKTKYITNTYGFYLCPTFNIYDNHATDTANRLIFYLYADLEYVRRSIRSEYEFDIQLTDTSDISFSNDSIPTIVLKSKPIDHERIYHEGYTGAGIGIHYRIKDRGILNLRYTFGTVLSPVFRTFSSRDDPKDRGIYYKFQFNFTERKSGITIGAEVRSFLPVYSPFYSIHLSKSFSIGKLADFLTGD